MKVYIDDQIQTYSEDDIARWTNELPDWRRKLTEAIKHDTGRRQSLLVYRLLCRALREEYGITEAPTFVYNEHGKPGLPPSPPKGKGEGWCVGGRLHFSLSHCRTAVACVVDDQPCGIDIESKGRRVSDSLIRYAMNDEEIREINDSFHHEGGREETFLRLWTQKEAVLKLIGTGIRDTMKETLVNCPYHLETYETERWVMSVAISKT